MPPASAMVRSFAVTDVGLRRGRNEDAVLADDARGLYAVADGLGGRPGGDAASLAALAAVSDSVDRARAARLGPATALLHAVWDAHRAVREGRSVPRGAATTLVVALLERAPGARARGLLAHVAHVGDSRAYAIGPGPAAPLRPLTTDHTLLEAWRRLPARSRRGQSPPANAEHVLERAVGTDEAPPVPDLTVVRLAPGDRLLLCTDGVGKVLDDRETEAILRRRPGSVEGAGRALLDAVLARGAPDNATLVLALVS
jgi:protein phosphatase